MLAERTDIEPAGFTLAPSVRHAVVDDDVVFLDLAKGAYVCMAGTAGAFAPQADGRLLIRDARLAAKLSAAGLLSPVAADTRRGEPPDPIPPRTSAVRWTYPPPRLGDLAPMLRAVADVMIDYRNQPLAQLLRTVADAPAVAPADDRLMATVDAFHRWIPYAPLPGKCLVRSFVLKRFLSRSGLGVDWVFGVATWPFRAHCWLQAGDVVLDDTVEHVAGYTPILVA